MLFFDTSALVKRYAVEDGTAVVDAIGRQRENEDIRVFLDRQGVAKFAAALHYATRIEASDLTERTAANKLGVHSVEGLTVFGAFRDVLEDAASYDPYSRPKRDTPERRIPRHSSAPRRERGRCDGRAIH